MRKVEQQRLLDTLEVCGARCQQGAADRDGLSDCTCIKVRLRSSLG
jgi:hypothetical protein